MVAPAGKEGIVALAGRRYAVERDWGRWPAGIARAMASQLAVDNRGRVHVFQRGSDPPVLVFDPDGGFSHAYGAGAVFDAHGIYIDARDRVFLADRDAHQIIVCGSDGRELLRLGERHRPQWELPFNHPTDAAVAKDGEIYVADGYGNARVHRFAPDGRHILSWGEVGKGPGEFMTPHAVWVDARDRVLVADRENDRVQLFDRDGHWLDDWGGLFQPMDIFEDAGGTLFVTDRLPSVTAFAPDGTRLGRCRASLNGAHGIFGDAAGNLFLAEIQPSCITRLRLL